MLTYMRGDEPEGAATVDEPCLPVSACPPPALLAPLAAVLALAMVEAVVLSDPRPRGLSVGVGVMPVGGV